MILTDLKELKTILEIPIEDTQEDTKLLFFIEWASQWIEELLNRPGLTRSTRTEYYQGTGTTKLLLRHRPVYTTPTIQVYIDELGHWGATSGSFNTETLLVYGTDYYLKVKEEGVPSREGILYRDRNVWPKPSVRRTGYLSPYIGEDQGSIKVIYSGGYTLDTLPVQFRMAVSILIAKMRHLFPLGMELSSESYEERGISILANSKTYLLKSVMDLILPYRNNRW